MGSELDDIRDSYSRIARPDADQFAQELSHKPLDCALLDIVVNGRPPESTVADVGCGPGHVTRYLHDRDVTAVGVDISPGMIALARERNPGIEFSVASLLDLKVPDGAWGAIVALYSIIHLPDESLGPAMVECARALAHGGVMLVSFHVGEGVVHQDEMLGHPVALDFHMLSTHQVITACEGAGMTVDVSLERRPYSPVEGPTTRGYVLVRKDGVSRASPG